MTERAMRQASVDRYAPAPADLPTIQTCRACGFLRFEALDCYGCEAGGKPRAPVVLPEKQPPKRPLPPVVAPEPLRVPAPAVPERRPPGREICDPLPLRRPAWKAGA